MVGVEVGVGAAVEGGPLIGVGVEDVDDVCLGTVVEGAGITAGEEDVVPDGEGIGTAAGLGEVRGGPEAGVGVVDVDDVGEARMIGAPVVEGSAGEQDVVAGGAEGKVLPGKG